ncbi:MAG: nuclear transport factor 2 family protein [Hyphomicrobiales bacterium]|nr:nuclear transport factor 2 family protein [Hyphomicrobiales bacterium]
MSKDLLKLAERYYAALKEFDYAALEKIFAEDAEYHSSGIGGLYGRPAIIEAMKAYFHEFSDQVSTNDSIEVISPSSVRTHWRLHATTKSSGRKVTRQGVETIHFNPKGLITTVEVKDVEPCPE